MSNTILNVPMSQAASKPLFLWSYRNCQKACQHRRHISTRRKGLSFLSLSPCLFLYSPKIPKLNFFLCVPFFHFSAKSNITSLIYKKLLCLFNMPNYAHLVWFAVKNVKLLIQKISQQDFLSDRVHNFYISCILSCLSNFFKSLFYFKGELKKHLKHL